MAQLEKIMSIYYGSNKLPYKDEDRQINYPVMGDNLFIGENNVTTIRFFVDRIGGNQFTWLVVVKLPDGSKVCRQLSQVSQEGYVDFDISSIYTSQQGAIYVALQGYTASNTNVTIDDENYVINGDPDILVTGVVKIMVNYAPQILDMGTDISYSQYQEILAFLSKKLGLSQALVFYQDISNISSSEIATDDLANGQIVYDETTKWFYAWDTTNTRFNPIALNSTNNLKGLIPLLDINTDTTNLQWLVNNGYNARAFMLQGVRSIFYFYYNSHNGKATLYSSNIGQNKYGVYETTDMSKTLGQCIGGLSENFMQLVSAKVSEINSDNKASTSNYPSNKAITDYVDINAIASYTFDSTTFQLKFYNAQGTQVGSTIDLPMESVVVSGSYDSTNKKIILTLENGSTIDISVSDLVSGLIPTSDIADNLTTNDSTKVLSAKQGYNLENNKLNKLSSSYHLCVYAKNSIGNDIAVDYDSAVRGDTLALRDINGRVRTANPSGDYDSMNKGTAESTYFHKANVKSSFSATPSDNNVASEKLVYDELTKVSNIASGCTTSYLTSISITESDILDAIDSEVAYYVNNNGELVLFESTSAFNTWKDTKTINQDIFASTNEQLAFSTFLSGHYCVLYKDDKFICIDINTYNLLFKDGDLLYVEGNYLDRWYFSNTLQINNGGSPLINESVVSGTTPSFNANSLVTYKCSSALTSLTISGLTQGQNDNNPSWQVQFVANSGFSVTLPNGCTWKYGTPTFNIGEEYTIIIEKRINNDYYAYLL